MRGLREFFWGGGVDSSASLGMTFGGEASRFLLPMRHSELAKKIALIENNNPGWHDLGGDL